MADNPFAKYAEPQTDNPFARYAVEPEAPTGPKQSLGRTVGLNARNLVQGAAAIPSMIANIPGGAYNAVANAVQGYKAPSRDPNAPFRFSPMQSNVSDILTKLGLPEPETGGERVGSDIAQAVAGGGGFLKGAQAMQTYGKPAVQALGRTLGIGPGKQLVSAGLGGSAAGLSREAGAPVPVQMGLSVAAGGLPYARPSGLVRGGALSAPEQRAMSEGFVLPPATMEKPSVLSKFLGGWSGKIKSQQAASVKNQALTRQVAAGSLGLPRDTILDDNVFNNLRIGAGKAYEDVKQSIPTIATDPAFQQRVSGLGNMNSDVATHFPELVKNDAIFDMAQALAAKQSFPTGAGVEAVKILRANATKNLQAIGDPERNALGFAQRDAADAIDDLMDRNITASGNSGLVARYRDARRLIAKSYDVEAATNTATGEINPRKLSMLADKGKPLSGGLEKIADTASAFPKAMQMPSAFGGAEPLSILDILAASGSLATGAMTGNLGTGAAIAGMALGRPLARNATLSAPYQRAMAAQPAPLGAVNMIPGQATNFSNIFRNNQ